MLIFKILAEKTNFCGREELFFGLYRFLVENFWFSPIFSGKTGLCGRGNLSLSLSIFSGKTGVRGREDLFFGLHVHVFYF